MNEALSIHWNEARRHEAAGAVDAARTAYEAMLALEPMQVVPRLRLSRFAQLSDRYIESRKQALEAARIAGTGRVGKDAGFVSLRLLAFAEDAEVVRLVESLDWSDGEVLKQSAVLAQHLWLAGGHEQALRFLDTVGARVRPNHLLSGTRANVLRSLGRLDEATTHYEHALQLRPDDPYLHRSLAYHQASAMPGARVPRIRTALARHRADSVERAHLLHALFKELDDMGDTDQAWEALAEGSAILRHGAGHDRAAEARQFDRLRSMDPAIAAPDPRAAEGPVPVFIVGMPRTGTTLLERILGNRPDTVALGERNDFDAAISQASDHFYRGGLHEKDWRKLELMDCRDAGAIYLGRVAPKDSQCRFFIDKNPQNFFNIGLILRALPQARILCLRRDPMDACFSNLKEVFEGGAYAYSYGFEDLAAHHHGYLGLLQHWKAIAPGSMHVVDYEALVHDGQATLEALLEFCGMRPVAGMLDITANQAPVSTASSSQVRQPIHARGIGAWRRYAGPLAPLQALLEADRRSGDRSRAGDEA